MAEAVPQAGVKRKSGSKNEGDSPVAKKRKVERQSTNESDGADSTGTDAVHEKIVGPIEIKEELQDKTDEFEYSGTIEVVWKPDTKFGPEINRVPKKEDVPVADRFNEDWLGDDERQQKLSTNKVNDTHEVSRENLQDELEMSGSIDDILGKMGDWFNEIVGEETKNSIKYDGCITKVELLEEAVKDWVQVNDPDGEKLKAYAIVNERVKEHSWLLEEKEGTLTKSRVGEQQQVGSRREIMLSVGDKCAHLVVVCTLNLKAEETNSGEPVQDSDDQEDESSEKDSDEKDSDGKDSDEKESE